MKRHALAVQLRRRQLHLSDEDLFRTYGDFSRRTWRWHRSVANRLPDAEIIDSYNTCPHCGDRQLNDDQLKTAIAMATSAENFIELVGRCCAPHGSES